MSVFDIDRVLPEQLLDHFLNGLKLWPYDVHLDVLVSLGPIDFLSNRGKVRRLMRKSNVTYSVVLELGEALDVQLFVKWA